MQARAIPIWRGLVVLLICLIPPLVTLPLTLHYANGDLARVLPAYSDEIVNWHQVATMLRAGLNGGYYTLAEDPAPASLFRYYAWGPWPYLLYAAPAGLIGWGSFSFPVLSYLAVGLALAGYCAVTRLGWRGLGLLALLMASFWPALLYYPTTMQDGIHYGLAIGAAALLVALWPRGSESALMLKGGTLAFISLMSLLRPSWALLFLPCWLLLLPRKRWALLLSLGLTGGLLLFFMAVFEYTRAPFVVPGRGIQGLGQPLSAYLEHFTGNLALYFDLGKPTLDVLFTGQVLVLLLVSAVVVARWLIARRQRVPHPASESSGWSGAEGWFHLYNLGVILLATLVVYTVGFWRDYRVISAYFLISLLLLLYFQRYRLLLLIVLSNLLFVPAGLARYHEIMTLKTGVSLAELDAFEASLNGQLVYDPAQTDGWCNTLMVSLDTLRHPGMIRVPPGLGISFFIRATDEMPMRSGYWLLEDANAVTLQAAHPAVILRPLAQTTLGTLYRNESVGCLPAGP
jgi:hypothetical protein